MFPIDIRLSANSEPPSSLNGTCAPFLALSFGKLPNNGVGAGPAGRSHCVGLKSEAGVDV